MPTALQLFIVSCVAASVATMVVLTFHFLGIGEYAVVVAAISGSMSSLVAMSQLKNAEKHDDAAA